mmetsp:Transcript_20493/g.33833  ORF Transcript_20493/g.33833 Transcript_20493/m.33833 type:complete len:222 (-) Transcript_20493:2304-2969(-)
MFHVGSTLARYTSSIRAGVWSCAATSSGHVRCTTVDGQVEHSLVGSSSIPRVAVEHGGSSDFDKIYWDVPNNRPNPNDSSPSPSNWLRGSNDTKVNVYSKKSSYKLSEYEGSHKIVRRSVLEEEQSSTSGEDNHLPSDRNLKVQYTMGHATSCVVSVGSLVCRKTVIVYVVNVFRSNNLRLILSLSECTEGVHLNKSMLEWNVERFLKPGCSNDNNKHDDT